MSYTKCNVIGAVFAFIGTLSGLSGFIVFSFVLGNIQAGVWAFISGLYAFKTLYLLQLCLRDTLDEWYATSRLFRIAIFGVLGCIASSIALISYITIIAVDHEGLSTKTFAKNHYIMAVWAALTLKWSLSLTFLARSLSQSLRSGYQPL